MWSPPRCRPRHTPRRRVVIRTTRVPPPRPGIRVIMRPRLLLLLPLPLRVGMRKRRIRVRVRVIIIHRPHRPLPPSPPHPQHLPRLTLPPHARIPRPRNEGIATRLRLHEVKMVVRPRRRARAGSYPSRDRALCAQRGCLHAPSPADGGLGAAIIRFRETAKVILDPLPARGELRREILALARRFRAHVAAVMVVYRLLPARGVRRRWRCGARCGV